MSQRRDWWTNERPPRPFPLDRGLRRAEAVARLALRAGRRRRARARRRLRRAAVRGALPRRRRRSSASTSPATRTRTCTARSTRSRSRTRASTSCSASRCSSTSRIPAAAVRELRRAVRPGGRVLLSTHGVYPFHPNPDDFWRWTHTGLEHLFRTNAEWTSVTVRPGAGTAATIAMLVAHGVDLLAKRAHVRPRRRAARRRAERRRRRSRPCGADAAAADPGLAERELPRGSRRMMAASSSRAAPASSARTSSRALLERGDEVRVLDNFSTGNRANLDGLDVEIVEGELRSYERVHNAVRGVEVVYHLGALGSVPRSVQDPLTSSAVNVEGTLNVLLAARDEGVRRVVFSSSASVYGSSRQLPTTEDVAARPDLAVRRREARGRALLRQLLARVRVVRDGRAALLQRLRPAAEPVLAVRGGGAALHHRDRRRRADRRSTATASSRATSPTSTTSSTRRSAPADAEGANGEIFNVAAGIARKRQPRRRHDRRDPRQARRRRRELPTRPGDIRDSWADLSKSERILGYRPRVDLRDGLRRTVESLRASERDQGPARHRAPQRRRARASRRISHRRPRRSRGYDTTLVAGTLARGEESMAHVAEASRRLDRGARRLASRDRAAQRRCARSSRLPR